MISPKTETFSKNVDRKFHQRSKILPKIDNFIKDRNFYQKSKILAMIENVTKNRKFYQRSNILQKIEHSTKNRQFYQRSKFLPKIENYTKDRTFYQRSKMFVNCLYIVYFLVLPNFRRFFFENLHFFVFSLVIFLITCCVRPFSVSDNGITKRPTLRSNL